MASEKGHHDVVQSLLGAGIEVNIATSDVSDVTCVHRVHVHVYCGEDRGEAQHGVFYKSNSYKFKFILRCEIYF